MRARLAMLVVYFLLIVGAVTTLYPFLTMVSVGFKGPTDPDDNRFLPAYWSVLDAPDDKGKLDPGSLLAKYLADKYAGDMSQIAATRTGESASEQDVRDYEQFLSELPPDYWIAGFRTAANQVTGRLVRRYQSWLRDRFQSIGALNKSYVEEATAFQNVATISELLDQKAWKPVRDQKFLDWQEFKRSLPPEFRIPIRERRLYQEFLRTKAQNQIANIPADVLAGATAFEQIPLRREGPLYAEFRKVRLPSWYSEATVEQLWERRHPGKPMPIEAYERSVVQSSQGGIKREFASRNFYYVLDYVLLNGRVLWNTTLFCVLAVLTQLTVNPLAAYALSRYPIRASGKILIFLLATMAFPAEVAMIPSFLLLKDLGLLNTFAALVLPGAASGYMIFLLKGFFDSLPQELFEAGQIDGAKESTMMMRIALPLSAPVLGYMALIAFMGAYGAFMYAFLVAQDQRIWTLMVWIYQLQGSAPKAVMMAALTLAAIPTLAVFLLAQRFILRGIVLPGER